MSRVLQATCLKPRYSLRYQLFASFGVTAACAIGVVVLAATLTAKSSGEALKTVSRLLLQEQVVANARTSSQHAADSLSKKFENLEGVVSLLGEVTRDRIVGYPREGWQNDENIPFLDTFSGRNIYPLVNKELPLDWNIDVNVNSTNYEEHVHDRWPWYADHYPISTSSANYRIQGACDPAETDPAAPTYYQNCTAANNDFSTGGVLQPTETNQYLAEKASDLAIFLKPLYETHTDVKHMGVYFANSGAGSSLVYPGYRIDGSSSYVSDGCDWMREINPNTGMAYGSEEEIARCHPAGARVYGREYNPLERKWCHDQALNPGKAEIVGPYLDAFLNDLWLLTIGKPVFDRMTGHFLGCTLLDMSIAHISAILESVQLDSYADIALLRWDDGTVIYSNQWNASASREVINVTDLDFCDERTFENLLNLVDFDKTWNASEWNATEIKDIFRTNIYTDGGLLIAAFPIPDPPEKYDKSYRPDFIVVQAVGEEIYSQIDKMESSIDEDIVWLNVATISIGVVGLSIVLLVSWVVAVYLTRPLNWMMDVCRKIVHHSSEKGGGSFYEEEEIEPLVRCSPKTEITALVSEFKSTIKSFSGNGPASVASPDVSAVLNRLNWEEDFGRAYIENLYETPVTPIGEGGLGERRISFVSSIASHTSIATLAIDESSNDEIDSDENIEYFPDVNAVVQESQVVAIEEEPSLSSMASQNEAALPTEPKDIDVDIPCLEKEEQETHSPQLQAKMPEKPTHLFTCSELCRSNKGYIMATIFDDRGAGCFENELRTSINHNQIRRSRLFWWIILLVVIPIILAMALICAIVTLAVTHVLPSWLEEAAAVSITLEKVYVNKSAIAHAVLTQEIFNPPVMDLHLLTRMASWLIFGGLNMSSSFPIMDQGTEECKTFPNDGSCPFFADPGRFICDCSWSDSHDTACQEYSNSRFLQKQHFAVQAQDADETGARMSTSYPAVDFSPSETLWWDEITKMPGYSNASLSQGYETVFDRTRIMSAMSVVNIPLYNYRAGGIHRKHLGMYIGWEDDGMLSGYSGCDYSFPAYAHFRSTLENGASKMSPNLCPLWKYGYDSRCRGWYDEGKSANSLHVTAPYVFAGTNEVANSVTLPLVDPVSGKHVGQTLIDFFPSGLDHAASADGRHPHGFVILITPESDALGGDTLAGPGYTMGSTNSTAVPIQKLVLPCDYDDASSENRRRFENQVLSEMKRGRSLDTTFRRRILLEDGSCDTAEEELFVSYQPVLIRELKPVKPNDFARGVQVSDILMASFGYIVPIQDLHAPFQAINDHVDDDIDRSIAILIGVIAAIAAITTFFLTMITISVVKPVTILLEFVILINKKHTLYDAPPMKGGSREVNQVYASLSKLHKIVRYSNMAFFSGKIKSAYRLLMDALSLFRGADDLKAIGIASNNLGNTLLAIRNQKLSTNTCFKVDGICVHRQALASYNEAIDLSTKEYEQSLHGANSTDFTAEHAEQLANRYFNRGLFFFLTSNDHCADADFIERGQRDLFKARELDEEVRNLWVQRRQVHKNSVLYFERLLRRANGLIDLMQKGIIDGTSCGIAQLLEEADSLLFVVWNVPGSPLFDALTPTGRLQQLEGAAIRFALCKGSTKEAARMSTRMLVEDEFIEEQAFNNAASALLSWFRVAPPPAGFRTTELAIRRDIRTMLSNSKIASDAALGSINLILLQDVATLDGCREVLPSFVQKLSDSCSDDDFVILPQQGSLRQESMLTVQRKGDMDETDWAEECMEHRIKNVNVEIRRSIHLCCESEDLSENDTWIVLTTDRDRWDSPQCRLSESHTYLISEIGQLNKARSTSVHFAIVSIDAKNVMSEICSEVCRVSRESLYMDLQGGTELLEDALADVASLIIGGGKKACSIPQGITMERF